MTIDGTTQPGYAGMPLIELNGAGAGSGSDGLTISAADSTVKGLIVSGFGGEGISVTGNDVVIQGNYIGTDSTGTVADGNTGDGIFVYSTDNTIGGTAAGAGNLISGNNGNGVYITAFGGPGASDNLVVGNDIGTNAKGKVALGNGGAGIWVTSSYDTIGGTTAGAGNLISGNVGAGVVVGGFGVDYSSLIEGNKIGTNLSGTLPLGNGSSGILVYAGGSGNTIGGTAAGAGNLISDNGFGNIYLSGTSQNTVQGNFIGTDITGKVALSSNPSEGVALVDATQNSIGGTTAGAGNVIAGNSTGILLFAGSTANLVEGNLVGTNASGSSSLGNKDDGIAISGASDNTVGGTAAGAGNLVSGNTDDGIYISGDSNLVAGNLIGTNAAGSAAIANGTGLSISGFANTIGGTVQGPATSSPATRGLASASPAPGRPVI